MGGRVPRRMELAPISEPRRGRMCLWGHGRGSGSCILPEPLGVSDFCSPSVRWRVLSQAKPTFSFHCWDLG